MEFDSLVVGFGLQWVLLWIYVVGVVCICIGIGMWLCFFVLIDNFIKELINVIQEIVNYNYEKCLELNSSEEFLEVFKNFNCMVKCLEDYYVSILFDMMVFKKYMEIIINSINEFIIGLNNDMEILFINDEVLNVINLKCEEVIKYFVQDIFLCNDLLCCLICELVEIFGELVKDKEKEKKEFLKIYVDNKESFF